MDRRAPALNPKPRPVFFVCEISRGEAAGRGAEPPCAPRQRCAGKARLRAGVRPRAQSSTAPVPGSGAGSGSKGGASSLRRMMMSPFGNRSGSS